MPMVLDYPGISVKLLNSRPELRLRCRDSMLQHFHALMFAEARSNNGSPHWRSVLNAVVWRNNPVIRLLLYTVANESGQGDVGAQSLYLSRSINGRFCDEKGVEDVHQHVRDLQRPKRHKHVPLASIYDSQIGSGVLESRVENSPCVGEDDVAQQAWRAVSDRLATRSSYVANPKDWAHEFNEILQPGRDWPSPTVPGSGATESCVPTLGPKCSMGFWISAFGAEP